MSAKGTKRKAPTTAPTAPSATPRVAQSAFVQAVLNTHPVASDQSSAFSASDKFVPARRGGRKRSESGHKVLEHRGAPQTLVCRACRKQVRLENADSAAKCPECKGVVLTVPKRDSAGFFKTGRVPF